MKRRIRGRESLGDVIALRKARDQAKAHAERKQAKKAVVAAKYDAKISAIAALCRKARIATLAGIRPIARQYLGLTRLESELPVIVQAEIARQNNVKRWDKAGQTAKPIVERWPGEKVRFITPKVRSVINEHYHTPNSVHSAIHYLDIQFGAPEASSRKSVGEWHKYGRMGYRPVYYDWNTTITLPADWLSQIRKLGTCEVEGMLILDVHDALSARDGAEACAVSVLVQHAGIRVSVQKMAIHRAANQPWRISALPIATRYDRLAERPALMRKPARRRSRNAKPVSP